MYEVYDIESNGWGIFILGGLSFYGAQSLIIDVFKVFVKFILM